MTDPSYYYKLGNGKEALYKARKYGPDLPSPNRITPELIEAKNCLYKANKNITSVEQPLAKKFKLILVATLDRQEE